MKKRLVSLLYVVLVFFVCSFAPPVLAVILLVLRSLKSSRECQVLLWRTSCGFRSTIPLSEWTLLWWAFLGRDDREVGGSSISFITSSTLFNTSVELLLAFTCRKEFTRAGIEIWVQIVVPEKGSELISHRQ